MLKNRVLVRGRPRRLRAPFGAPTFYPGVLTSPRSGVALRSARAQQPGRTWGPGDPLGPPRPRPGLPPAEASWGLRAAACGPGRPPGLRRRPAGLGPRRLQASTLGARGRGDLGLRAAEARSLVPLWSPSRARGRARLAAARGALRPGAWHGRRDPASRPSGTQAPVSSGGAGPAGPAAPAGRLLPPRPPLARGAGPRAAGSPQLLAPRR